MSDTRFVNQRMVGSSVIPDEAIPLDRLVLSADGAKKLRVIILDACRDNPYAGKMRRESRAALRAVSSGLGKVEPSRSTSNLKMIQPQFELLPDEGDDAETRLLEVGRITPVYESLGGARLASRWQRKTIFNLLEGMRGAVPECLPTAMLARLELPDRETALDARFRIEPVGDALTVVFESRGGTRGSAFGDLKMRGEDGVRFFTQQKMVTVRWPEPGRREALSLVFPGNR